MELAFDPKMASSGISAEKANASGNGDPEKLKQLCQDFESILIHTMFKQMRQSVPDDGYLEHGMEMEMFQEMMDMETAREMSRKGGLGLGQLLYEQFSGQE